MAINIKPSHKGLLHKNLGVPQGRKIPVSKLAVKSTDSEAVRKRKQFAINAKKWKHEDGGFIDNRSLPEFPEGGKVEPVYKAKTMADYKAHLQMHNDSLTLATPSLWNEHDPEKDITGLYWNKYQNQQDPDYKYYKEAMERLTKANGTKPLPVGYVKSKSDDRGRFVENVDTLRDVPNEWYDQTRLFHLPKVKVVYEPETDPINRLKVETNPNVHQGYRNQQAGVTPGLYAEGGNIDYDYRWDNGLPRAINRAAYREGGRVIPRYEVGGFHLPATNNTLNNLQNNTPGKSGTGANIAGTQPAPNYTNAAIGVGGALVGAAAELIPGVTHTDADGNVTSSRKSIGAEVLGDAAQGASMGVALGPWGALAGAGLGAIYGGVKGVMNKNAADAADATAEGERQNRITNNIIRNGPKTYTGQSVNTGSTFIAREGGNVPNDNFDYSAGGEFSNTDNNVIHAPEMGGYFIKRK